MKSYILISFICVLQFVPALFDDSTETTTTPTSGESTTTTGTLDFAAFDEDLTDIYKSIAKIKSKATKLELVGPKIQSAMLHLEGDEEQTAKDLQKKYEQLLPLLQKINDNSDQKSATAAAAAAANGKRRRRRRDVSSAESTPTTTVDIETSTISVNTDDTTIITTESVSPSESTITVGVSVDNGSQNITSNTPIINSTSAK